MSSVRKSIIFIAMMAFVVTLTTGCGGGSPNQPVVMDVTPCDPSASEGSKKVLAYLGGLTDESIPGIISGQNCGHGNEILTNYSIFIEALHQQTGKYVGMIGIDYEFQKVFTLNELLNANEILKDYWRQGGWVTINFSPDNPWSSLNDYTDIQVKYEGTDLNKLIDPGEIHDKWMAKLDKLAAALDDLQKAGVVVLWRPMQEMNGWWFWWGKADNSPKTLAGNHDAYVRVWRHMYDYFTNTKHLHNLLWVFSPTQTQKFSKFPYPGDDVVDIIAGTDYNNDLVVGGYEDYIEYHKPTGMAECGPSQFTDVVINGSFDDRLYPRNFQRNYPHIAYWVTWHSWYGVKMAIVDNQNASECLNDPYVINRGARQ